MKKSVLTLLAIPALLLSSCGNNVSAVTIPATDYVSAHYGTGNLSFDFTFELTEHSVYRVSLAIDNLTGKDKILTFSNVYYKDEYGIKHPFTMFPGLDVNYPNLEACQNSPNKIKVGAASSAKIMGGTVFFEPLNVNDVIYHTTIGNLDITITDLHLLLI